MRLTVVGATSRRSASWLTVSGRPHLTARVPEAAQLVGREQALITALTDAVAEVYGQWARDIVVVHLDGVPQGRWGIGGRAADEAAPAITFGIREAACRAPAAARSQHGLLRG
jgi:phenylpyruvate tautomerase PptA (4-oxalocrotonate tautomerase family)